jgi:hypothetical protein
LLRLPGQLPGIISLGPITIIDQQLLIDAIAIFDEKSAITLPIVEDFNRTVNGCNFLAQEMPAKVGLAGRLPAGTFASIQSDSHGGLLSGMSKKPFADSICSAGLNERQFQVVF